MAARRRLYLIADAGEMARAHDALADYHLAIRWPECQQFDTNLIGTYQWCPLARNMPMNRASPSWCPATMRKPPSPRWWRDFRAALPDATIYVYDNNSRDQTVARAREAGAVVRTEPRQGKGNVVRRMFADIEADIYVLVDGDDTYDAARRARHDRAGRSADGADLLTARRIHTDAAAYRPGHVLGNRHADRPGGAAVQCPSVRHAVAAIASFPAASSKAFPSPPKASPSRRN